ncbi:SufD family Fe-S cluster assembly protein [[Mycoplasma] testudinis]|uniref:SufD family Fe-S cluster assembly protein n=1 Tax=[Mycoplasma] testudinis TaxID=33924 RepID=UPI000484E5B3|nr:SufD family Fe-S cluster assembly protein [[Mycoplasma] testudinis]
MLKKINEIHQESVFLEIKKTKNNLEFIVPDGLKTAINILDLYDANTKLNAVIKLGKKSEAKIIVSSFATNNQSKHYNVKIDHLQDDGTSSFQCYVVAAKKADTKIQITSDIKPKTNHNNTAQQIKGVLLSNDAQIHGEPQLIIDDNNVKAIHAMAIGRINPNQIFYLMSRGLTKALATQLILIGYFNTTLVAIKDDELLDQYHQKIQKLFKDN